MANSHGTKIILNYESENITIINDIVNLVNYFIKFVHNEPSVEENVENDSCEEKAEQEPKRRVTFEGAAHKEGVQVVSNEAYGRKAFVAHFGCVFEAGAEERK